MHQRDMVSLLVHCVYKEKVRLGYYERNGKIYEDYVKFYFIWKAQAYVSYM